MILKVLEATNNWVFPKIRGKFLGVPIIRTIVYWGLFWGTPYFGKLRAGLKLTSYQKSAVGFDRSECVCVCV